MKIYAIFEDNNQPWDDHYYGLNQQHIYLDAKMAEEACFKLNNPVFISPDLKEWEESKDTYYGSFTYEDYIDICREIFERDYYTYSITELNIIT